jgi:CRP-like cAMP-binding protein
LLIVARRSFLPLLERPVIAHELLNVLCERLRRTTEQLEDVLFLDLEVRIAKILLRFAEAGGPAQPGARVAVCFGRVGSRWSDPATRSALREQMPIAVSELADQYLMRSVTWASSALTAKAASLNR